MDIKTIREHLKDTATYHGMSFAAIVQVAAEIEAVEDKETRSELRREFRQAHSLTSQVWARVADRFPDFANESAQAIRAFSYCCQLPQERCDELLSAHYEHINEPGALALVLADVNAELDSRRNGHATPRKPSLAEQCADKVIECRREIDRILNGQGREQDNNISPEGWYGSFADWLAALPAVADALAKRERK